MNTNSVIEAKINDIIISPRIRKDMGDLKELAQSIDDGLLQPIGVTPDYELIFGERRLRAYRDILGRDTIPVRIVEVKSVLLGQIAENTMRKDFTPSELVAIVDTLRSYSHGGDRKSDQALNRDVEKLTVDQAAKLAGLGGKDGYGRAKAVIAKGIPELVQAMDSGKLTVSAASKLACFEPEQQRRVLEKGPDHTIWFVNQVRTSQRIRKRHDNPVNCTGKKQAEAYKPRLSQESGSTKPKRPCKVALLEPEVQQRRLTATTLLHGDAVEKLKTIPDGTADVCLFDPPYPCIKRPYGTLTEGEWHDLIDSVLTECHRILKPQGSVVLVIQPNYEVSGRMRLWPWRCVVRAAEMWDDWGLVQDVYWFSPNALPCGGTQRSIGLLRTSIKWCVWLGRSDCYRNQEAVLKPPAAGTISGYCTSNRKQVHSSGHRLNLDGFDKALTERCGVTPLNLLTVPIGGPNPQGHPAVTPYRLAEWWCQYVLPPCGVLVDPFCGSGTTLLAALNCGASQVVGIDKGECYLDQARRRMCEAVAEEKTDWNSPAEQLWWKEYSEVRKHTSHPHVGTPEHAWVRHQLNRFRLGALEIHRQDCLDSIPWWRWERSPQDEPSS